MKINRKLFINTRVFVCTVIDKNSLSTHTGTMMIRVAENAGLTCRGGKCGA